jgi:hypothetical protein
MEFINNLHKRNRLKQTLVMIACVMAMLFPSTAAWPPVNGPKYEHTAGTPTNYDAANASC